MNALPPQTLLQADAPFKAFGLFITGSSDAAQSPVSICLPHYSLDQERGDYEKTSLFF